VFEASLYERLGVTADADPDALRAAYRRRALELHPDHGGDATRMAAVNEAWAVLSDPARRHAYDASLHPPPAPSAARIHPPAAPSPVVGWRRQSWVGHQRNQIRRLASQAGRSAAQTLALRHPAVPRSAYEDLVAGVVERLIADTEARLREVRQAGAAPLDLANAAALVGLAEAGGEVSAAWRHRPSEDLRRRAELIDRMWDVMAHELPRELTQLLGGNPRVSRQLR
jgi:curved DNA-binding protein CbpA